MLGKILKQLGVTTKELYIPTLSPKTQPTADTAGEVLEWDLGTDQFGYDITLKCAKSTDGALADNIASVSIVLDGSKTIREIPGAFLKAIALLRGAKPSTGFYTISIGDEILATDPLFLKNYSSCVLKVKVAAAGSGVKNVVTPTVNYGSRSSYSRLVDTAASRLNVELIGVTQPYGANTGKVMYEHQRGQIIAGYLYLLADNGTPSNTVFSTYTLKLSSENGHKTIHEDVDIATIREWNTQEAGGNALPTGVIYIPIPDTLKTIDYTAIKAYFNIPTAGTNAQITALERQIFG
jgi:hypothetical protein